MVLKEDSNPARPDCKDREGNPLFSSEERFESLRRI